MPNQHENKEDTKLSEVKPKPIYKQWWFWLVGVGVFITTIIENW